MLLANTSYMLPAKCRTATWCVSTNVLRLHVNAMTLVVLSAGAVLMFHIGSLWNPVIQLTQESDELSMNRLSNWKLAAH